MTPGEQPPPTTAREGGTPPDPFDLSRYPAGESPGSGAGPPRHRPGEKFLKGPVPWDWVRAAARLPGKALAAGLGVWFEAGCASTGTVPVTLARLARVGISRDAARRALAQLERAGLATLDRRPGRATRVTLLSAPADRPAGGGPP
jgi:DNA-binding transcriptional ArsR family regulator